MIDAGTDLKTKILKPPEKTPGQCRPGPGFTTSLSTLP
jgi:hypothetical protein